MQCLDLTLHVLNHTHSAYPGPLPPFESCERMIFGMKTDEALDEQLLILFRGASLIDTVLNNSLGKGGKGFFLRYPVLIPTKHWVLHLSSLLQYFVHLPRVIRRLE